MSPEQATGDQAVGVATDIYALGAVLYEMLIGDPPYTGSTAQAILGKIIAGKLASATEERASVPANVDAAIRKALEKLPADRFAGAQDFASALGDPGFRLSGDSAAAPGAPLTGVGKLKLAAGIAIGLGLGLGGAPLWSWITEDDTPDEIIRFAITLADSIQIDIPGNGHELAISPDGRLIAYQSRAGGGGLEFRLRPLDQLESAPIRGTQDAYGPVFPRTVSRSRSASLPTVVPL
jgi:serine/threonine-protein kinase